MIAVESAFVPGRISGFFQVTKNYECLEKGENPEKIGSKGAGVNITLGGVTTVKVKSSNRLKVEVYINGIKTKNAYTTFTTVDTLLSYVDKKDFKIRVYHDFKIPIGCGYGASGVGALGVSLALNEALGLRFTEQEACNIAHIAEVKCKTGLGTVCPQLIGGFVFTMKGGGFGANKLIKIPFNESLRVVGGIFGPISTKHILSNRKVLDKVNTAGAEAIDCFSINPSIESFLEVSRNFMNNSDLATERVKKILNTLSEKFGIIGSMNMLGEAIFTIVEYEDVKRVTKFLKKYFNERNIIVCEIDAKGAKILE
ncbi:MAG: pantoate kinase [Candidatus Odinarchaeia archaeon]